MNTTVFAVGRTKRVLHGDGGGGIPFYWSMLKKELSLPQNIDAIFFSEDGELTDEFDALYHSLFRKPEAYITVINALGKKRIGMSREEIVKESGLAFLCSFQLFFVHLPLIIKFIYIHLPIA